MIKLKFKFQIRRCGDNDFIRRLNNRDKRKKTPCRFNDSLVFFSAHVIPRDLPMQPA